MDMEIRQSSNRLGASAFYEQGWDINQEGNMSE